MRCEKACYARCFDLHHNAHSNVLQYAYECALLVLAALLPSHKTEVIEATNRQIKKGRGISSAFSLSIVQNPLIIEN